MKNRETLLVLGKQALPPCSARGCSQELYPLAEPGVFRRTLNGRLVYAGDAATHHRYGSVIRGEDEGLMALDPLKCGDILEVGCLVPLVLGLALQGGEEILLGRPAVKGSVSVRDACMKPVDFEVKDDQRIVLSCSGKSTIEPVFASYRPFLVMMVRYFSGWTDEWGMKSRWTLTLEEV